MYLCGEDARDVGGGEGRVGGFDGAGQTGRAWQVNGAAGVFNDDGLKAEALAVDGGEANAEVVSEAAEEEAGEIAFAEIPGEAGGGGVVVLKEGGVGVDVGAETLAEDAFGLGNVEGRVKLGAGGLLQRINDVSGASLIPFVAAAVESGTEVRTDGWRGYYGLSEQGYKHHAINISSTGDPAHVSLPGVHSVASLLKRWLLGTHQGSVTAEHLDAYLNEFAFRFNRRHSRRRGLLFLRLLQHAVVTPPTRYRPSRSLDKIGNHSL